MDSDVEPSKSCGGDIIIHEAMQQPSGFSFVVVSRSDSNVPAVGLGAGITDADDRQATTVFTVQPSFHHRRSINRIS